MANEIDKTIEELEAEVLDELEEANGADAPMKSAAPAEKIKMEKDYEDTGKAVVDPEQKDAPAKKVAAKAKEVSGDAQQKGEGAPEKMQKLAAGHEPEGEEALAEMEKMEMAKMTKEMMVNAMYEMMKGKKKTDLQAMYNGMKKINY